MNCKKCDDGQMVEKLGKNGPFMACNNWPACKNTESMLKGEAPNPTSKAEVKELKPKDYHLSPEEVNARALEAAIECSSMAQRQETKILLELANVYVKYIMGNGYLA